MNQEIEHFFGSTWNKTVFRLRPIIFVTFAAWLSFAIWKATQLSPLTAEEFLVPESHPSRIAELLIDNSFSAANEEMPWVEIFWGGKAIDKSKVHPFNSTYTGELELDNNFNMAAPESQQFLLDLCGELK